MYNIRKVHDVLYAFLGGGQEDALAATVASFHRHLPLDKLSYGRMGAVQWGLAKPSIGSAVSETWGGVVGVIKSPIAGGHDSGMHPIV